LLLEVLLVFLEVFPKHVLPAQLIPPPEVVHLGPLLESVFLEHPVDLFLLAPHHVPVIAIRLSPLSVQDALVDAVAERCFEFNVLPKWRVALRRSWVMLFFYVFSEVL
jgi:hypothetical protein